MRFVFSSWNILYIAKLIITRLIMGYRPSGRGNRQSGAICLQAPDTSKVVHSYFSPSCRRITMIKTIPVRELRPGMYLQQLGESWLKHPFWRNSFLIESEEQIRQIREAGIQQVTIDTSRGQVAEAANDGGSEQTPSEAAKPTAKRSRQRPRRVAFEDELEEARRLRRQSAKAVKTMLTQARMGEMVHTEDMMPYVEQISDSIMRQPSAMLGLVRIKNSDEYTYMHSVAVCALMVALARQMGFKESEVQQAGMAGLMHDMGKAYVPNDILNKPDRLTEEEFRIIQTHPEKGYQALLQGGKASEIVLDVVRHHHEKMDGQGYPRGLDKSSISLFARMGAVCDVYDAVTSDRPYKPGWAPAEALSRMARWTGSQFDERVFQAFVKTIGIYPTGSLVRLSSGRLAVVLDQGTKDLLKPRVKAFYSSNAGTHIPPTVIDLGRPGVSERIESREDPKQWGFDKLEALWA
ncbi:putative nucleotidyltransferase with HDIG domain [Natronospira proteinivora]|uniref:Nucleotidyltransferase with HDIG domain n=1 Tax=Natronospira proteinivora TaxID=1807133 RepID=A0ABT1G7Y8_9GAMM|nr:HD-GYP domain-containing protein [Natronospira proteinivora]MCP1727404.1 putative nucleotidyltransferase with HDIG domain [Natronospira proteinivora]